MIFNFGGSLLPCNGELVSSINKLTKFQKKIIFAGEKMVDDATLKEISILDLTISGKIGLIKYCYWQQIGLVYGTFFLFFFA